MITEDKIVEPMLVELALMSDYCDEMVIIADIEGKISWVNHRFLDTYGYQLHEVLGKKPGDFLCGPDSSPQAAQDLRVAINSSRVVDCQTINYRKDGSTCKVHISLGPIYISGQLQGFLAVERVLST